MANDIKGRATVDQMIALNGFLKLDPQLLSGKFSSSFTFKTAQKCWEKIAESLNAMPGAVKNWNKWRKTFQDNRTKAKTKQAMIRAAQRKTGHNTPCSTLTVVGNDVLELINPTSISGHTTAKTSKVNFSFSEQQGVDIIDNDNIIVVQPNDNWPVDDSFLKSPSFGTSSPIIPNSPKNPNLSLVSSTEESNEKIKDTNKRKTKKSTTAQRLEYEGNSAAANLVSLEEKKLALKASYNEKKLELLREQNEILRQRNDIFNRIAVALTNRI